MPNLTLVRPSEEHIEEIRSYRDEFRAHDTHSHGDSGLYKSEDIATWINGCRQMENTETLPSPNHVEADQFMLIQEGNPEILGMISLRRRLIEGYLAEHGGHIGYGVRPTQRRKGYAKAMLALCLEEARNIGLTKVLICCDLDNAGSRGTIKACGGQFERLAITDHEVDERYWITLDKPQAAQPENSNFNTKHGHETAMAFEGVSAGSDKNCHPQSQTPHLNNYYTTQCDESQRLTSKKGLVEYLTTMRYVDEYLTPEAKVLEIGAGTGRYSQTIANMGHKVEAVELIDANIEIFKKNLKPTQNINITQASALDLSMFASNTFDITLLLGPLYHLFTQEDKHQAIKEALRVTKPGGIIFAAYCLTDASIARSGFANNRFSVKEYIQQGKINPQTFATTSVPEDIFELVRKEDIDNLMKPFPVERLHYVATDLFAPWIGEQINEMDDETYALYLRHHFAICERPDLSGAGYHSLDVFRKL